MVLALVSLASRAQSNIGLIRAGVSRGMTSTQIQGLIRATGQAGIRRQDLLEGIRHVQGRVQSGTRIQNTRRDRFPDPRRIEPAKGVMLRNFSYDVRVSGFDPETGVPKDVFITIRSDENLRLGDIQDMAQEVLDTAPALARYSQLGDEITLTVVGARRRT